MLVGSIVKKRKKYCELSRFQDICEITSLIKIARETLNDKFYSINEEEVDKIVLQQISSNKYELYIMNREGERKYIQKGEEAPEIFRRFYCEVDYLMRGTKKIDEYEKVFGEKLSYDERRKILGY